MSHHFGLVRILPAATVIVFFVLLPIIILYGSRTLRGGAELFPIALSGLMLACMLCRTVLRCVEKKISAKADGATVSGAKLAGCVVVLFLFIPLAEHTGFYAASFIFIIIGYLAFLLRRSARDVAYAIVTASVFTIGTKMIFYDLLHIMTPTGLLW